MAKTHQQIGIERRLFMFDETSPGSCFFLPDGAHVYNKLIDFLKNEYKKRGFQEIITPNIYKADLWKISGHWDKYRENMFTFEAKDDENHVYGLKAMNCPGHCLVFKSFRPSYKDLPLRFADFGVLHRNELSGTLTGLTRVRRFQQDDAHIFCRRDQIRDELINCLDFLTYVYDTFGFDYKLYLSTRPEKYMGELSLWNEAEAILESVLSDWKKWDGAKKEGDGAFYGPKIDIEIMDSLGRSHQCATIQLDFQLPSEDHFNLLYQTEDNEYRERPIIIHRAIYGSLERFIAILLEHTQGNLPFWLSPKQVSIVIINNKQMDYARLIQEKLRAENYIVDIDESDLRFNKKIRNNVVTHNYVIIIGDKEVNERNISYRHKDNQVNNIPLEEFIDFLKK